MSVKNELAFVFPGQGSQKIGMLAEIAERSELIRNTFEEASNALGYDLWDLVQSGSQEQINMTEVTQPALLTCSVALWRLWQHLEGPEPAVMAGHSLGEWSALVCSGVVAFESAVKLVRARGQYMQEAVPAGVGAMAAIIGLDDGNVETACASASTESCAVTPVNYNSPGQLVIAGHKDAVDRAIVASKDLGAKRALLLPVSAPFHTPLMRPAAMHLAEEIETIVFSPPSIPVVHNVNASTASEPAKIKALIIEQIYSPVRWVSCVQALNARGATSVLECGPGKVLSGLNKRIIKGLVCYNVETAALLDKSLVALK